MLGRQTCIDCGRLSPETRGEITLTTSFGWRVRRAAVPPNAPASHPKVEWRCPACWQRFKAASNETPSSPPPPSSPRTPRR